MLICPLHELIPIVGPRTEFTDELVPVLPSLLIKRNLLLVLRLNEAVTSLFAAHFVEHEVQSHECYTRLIAPIKTKRVAIAHLHTIRCRNLVAMQVDVLEDVHICSIWISFRRGCSRLEDDLQGVWYRGLFLETERKWKLRELALAHELVEVIEHGRGHVKWIA